VPIPVPLAYYSFGGLEALRIRDANQHGTDGVRFYTKLKTVTARWPKARAIPAFIMPDDAVVFGLEMNLVIAAPDGGRPRDGCADPRGGDWLIAKASRSGPNETFS